MKTVRLTQVQMVVGDSGIKTLPVHRPLIEQAADERCGNRLFAGDVVTPYDHKYFTAFLNRGTGRLRKCFFRQAKKAWNRHCRGFVSRKRYCRFTILP